MQRKKWSEYEEHRWGLASQYMKTAATEWLIQARRGGLFPEYLDHVFLAYSVGPIILWQATAASIESSDMRLY